jgi:hypothetical protein
MKTTWGVAVTVGAVCAACGGGGGDGVTFSKDHPRIYLRDHKDALAAALTAKQAAAMRLKAVVDKWLTGGDKAVYNFGAWNAALIGQLTGDPKYCAAAINAVDQQVNDATSAVAGGGDPAVASDDYLGVGDMIGNLAVVYDWCAGSLSAERRAAWLNYADQAVYNVWNFMQAKWGTHGAEWSGWAIDDPSDNYYYSFLRATMMLGLAAKGDDPKADGWIAMFRDTKIQMELVPAFDADLAGGGSREGTGYGVSMRGLFELYDLWAGSTGERIADLTPHTQASMTTFMHQIVPTLDRIAPTGDQSRDSTAMFFDYHRNYLQELIALYPDDPVSARAQALLAASSLPRMANDFMVAYDFVYANTSVQASTLDGFATAHYAPGIGEIYARSGWDKDATWVNLIAGPYTQSHAHQDQGSLMIYKSGWLGYDAVIDSHSGLPQETTAHSLVRLVDGKGNTIAQQLGSSSKLLALHRGTGWLHAAADITPVYKKSSGVTSVQREIVYIEPDTVAVYDRVTTASGGSQVWQLVSPAAPAIGSPTTFAPAKLAHKLSVQSVSVPASTAPTSYSFEAQSSGSDFLGGFRLDETAPSGDNRFVHLLWVDGAATGVAATDGNGVSFTVDGQPVTVQWSRAAVGATLTIGGQTITLGAGVDTLSQ